MVEQHLEQRVVAQAAGRLQGLDQLFERQVLMVLGAKGCEAHLFEQFADPQRRIEAGAQHLGVDEEADQPLGLQPVPVGHRHADADIGLATVAVQHGLERGQQHHEHRDIVLLGKGLQAFGKLRGQCQPEACAAVALHGGPGMIGGQLQYHGVAAQLLGPVGQLLLARPGIEPLALPVCIVQVLDRQGRQRRRVTCAEAGVALHPLIDHHLHGPAI
ncbi:hypothetical protein PS627_04547 [Pseudomonas fluorescens]|nr:hypothetical protein PS627_04547 [Pseudomonas fluorescens]